MSHAATIKRIQNVMRQDVGVDGDAQRIGQLTWLLFLRIFDESEQEAELLDSAYSSPLPDALRWNSWAANPEGITGDELLSFVNTDLFPSLKKLTETGGQDERAQLVGGVFEDAYNYMKSGTLLRQVVNELNTIEFDTAQDRHEVGTIYEDLLKDLQSAGNAGEFYTPRAVTKFIIDIVNPRLGELVLDPACGTGGFLAGAIDHVRDAEVDTNEDELLLQASIHGVEKKQLPHLLCTTNMLLHGIDVPTNIRHGNTLARPLRDYGPKDQVDVIVANPPFGGTEEPGTETNFPAAYRTTETADLFLVLIIRLLKHGGRAGLVLPDGTLFGEGVKSRIKELLLNECNLHTIVRLPPGVFNPYAAVRTNLLFFSKGEPTKEVWFYEHALPTGRKTYTKGRPIRSAEFEPELEWWPSKARHENSSAWKVSIDEIKARGYNLDISNPSGRQAVTVDADEVIAEYDELLGLISDAAQNLKSALHAALAR